MDHRRRSEGHRLLEIAYNSTSLPIIDRVLSGRSVTPLAEYYRAANTLLVDLTGRTLFLLLCVALFVFGITRPRRLVPLSVLILTSSFSVFWLLEVYPPLTGTLHLDRTSNHSMSIYKIPYPEMGFRGRPLLEFQDSRVGDNSYARYRLEAPSGIIEWTSNRDGFRDSASDGVANIVVIGDSFMNYGWTEEDTFGKRLQRHLDSWKIANLAVAGWSPHQYLQALKRYGVQKRPKNALFSFYAGNDFWQIKDYLQWKNQGAPLFAYACRLKIVCCKRTC